MAPLLGRGGGGGAAAAAGLIDGPAAGLIDGRVRKRRYFYSNLDRTIGEDI